MKTTQTIELDDDERAVLGKALYLIDQIWKVTDAPMADIFEYFTVNSDLTADGHYKVNALHSIKEIRGEE